MKIRKKYQTTTTQAQILNGMNTSEKSGYSCKFINTLVLGEELFKGDSTGSITLAKDITLFHRIKVYGYTTHSSSTDRYINFCQEFLVSGQTNRYGLIATAHAGSAVLYIAATMLTISGTSVTKGNQAVYLTNNSKDDAEVFHITEIRGFYS
jgi:hypothetical protein